MHNNEATTLRLKQQTYIFLIWFIQWKGNFPAFVFAQAVLKLQIVGEHYNLMEVFVEEAMELKVTQ